MQLEGYHQTALAMKQRMQQALDLNVKLPVMSSICTSLIRGCNTVKSPDSVAGGDGLRWTCDETEDAT